VRYGEKSYPLPNGQRIGYHWAEADWTITDADALFTWAKGKGLVRAHEETDWGEQVKPRLVPAKDVVGAEAVDRESGEVVPGVLMARPAGDVLMISEGRRRRSSHGLSQRLNPLDPSAGAGNDHADVREHVGVSQDPRVGAREIVV
jgi:hypothetical protein